MENQKELYANFCFDDPISCFKISSCNRWLSCGPCHLDKATFSPHYSDASFVFLLPYVDGRYKLQLQPTAFLSNSFKAWFLSCREFFVGAAERHSDCTAEDLLFSLEFDEHRRMRLRGGETNEYLATDTQGNFRIGIKSSKKWEFFTLVEQSIEDHSHQAPWTVRAPTRITLQAHTGKYLCGARPILSARAEAPCCCEEFLIDFQHSSFTSLSEGFEKPDESSKGFSWGLLSLFGKLLKQEVSDTTDVNTDEDAKCTIRTADGTCLLSAEPDGNVYTRLLNEAVGMETFSIQLQSVVSSPNPTVCIRQTGSEGRYLSAEAFGHLSSKRTQKTKSACFKIQLANGSRVLLKSIHGGYLGEYTSNIPPSKKQNMNGVSSWQLRSHGDSLYTLVSASVMKSGADVYMFVDSSGRLYQSSDPAVHFPAAASLFEIKPVTAAAIGNKNNSTSSGSIVGFSIRTVRKINGKQRYLGVEPNGCVSAIRLAPTRWELFQVIDVDATAAAVAPFHYSCTAAARKLEFGSAPLVPLFQDTRTLLSTLTSNRSNLRTRHTSLPDTYNRACSVAAKAVRDGKAVPVKSSISLQELCISQICWQASTGSSYQFLSGSEVPEILPVVTYQEQHPQQLDLISLLSSLTCKHEPVPNVLTDEGAFTIPDDLLLRIWSTWRLKQVPRESCKWLSSSGGESRVRNIRFVGVVRSSSFEGWHCTSCDNGRVLPMDADVNPAHHRYLEVQSRAYSRALQSTGFLWNIISLAGVSIMSTALVCQIKVAAARRTPRI